MQALSKVRGLAVLVSVGLLAGALGSLPAAADHNDHDDHSKDFVHKAREPITIGKDLQAQGSDLAFKRKLVIAGSFQGTGIFRSLKRRPFIKQLSFLPCNGGQGDVSVYKNYVFVSVDSVLAGPTCKPDETGAAPAPTILQGGGWEGIRIIDISDPKQPRYVKSIRTPCGSHTNTLLPGATKSHILISSYPLTPPTGTNPTCNDASHQKVSIIEFPNNDPTKAKLLDDTISTTPAKGCHDITTFPKKDIMFGACITQSMIWDISKGPTEAKLLSTIENPNVQIHHSTAMTWDGKYLVLGDEYGGAAAPGGCTGDEDSTVGAAWFYKITDPSNPELVGHHALPRVPSGADSAEEGERVRCTNHNFNVIPMKDPNKYLLAVSYYMGGIAVVDFSDPSDPTEIGHYVTTPGGIKQDTWSAYWYNGRIYTNDYLSRLGVGVYRFKKTGRWKAHFFRKTPLNPHGEMNPQVQIRSW